MLVDLYNEQGRYLGQFHHPHEPGEVILIRRGNRTEEVYKRTPPPGRYAYSRVQWSTVDPSTVNWEENVWNEVEWVCQHGGCGTVNMPVRRHCRFCGAPKPPTNDLVCTECLTHGPGAPESFHSNQGCKYSVHGTKPPAGGWSR